MLLRSGYQSPQNIVPKQPQPRHSPSVPRNSPSCSSSRIQKSLERRKANLTRWNLKRLERESMGKNKKNASKGSSSSGMSKSSNTTTTDKKFGERIEENGIQYRLPFVQPPSDLVEMREYLERERESQSGTEEDYQKLLARASYADNEQTFETNIFQLLRKDPYRKDQFGYDHNANFQWTETEASITNDLSKPKPDLSESFRHSQYPLQAVKTLGSSLKPTLYGQAMPRICFELKGPDGLLQCAEKQAAYDGAVMVDGAWETHKYMAKQAEHFLSETQALTGTINGSNLHLYANHAIEKRPASGPAISPLSLDPEAAGIQANTGYPEQLEYHQHRLKGVLYPESFEDFQRARKYVRNAQDWARERAIQTKDDLFQHFNASNAAAAEAAAEAKRCDSLDGESAVSSIPPTPLGLEEFKRTEKVSET